MVLLTFRQNTKDGDSSDNSRLTVNLYQVFEHREKYTGQFCTTLAHSKPRENKVHRIFKELNTFCLLLVVVVPGNLAQNNIVEV